jgi:transcriptional antiterminator Rof (Rho-off)
MSEASYQPVACGFYDELGLRMMRGTACRLVVEQEGERVERTGQIDDLYTEGEAEYVRLNDDSTIRLDHIVTVDEVER